MKIRIKHDFTRMLGRYSLFNELGYRAFRSLSSQEPQYRKRKSRPIARRNMALQLTSLFVQSALRTSFSSTVIVFKTFSTVAISSFLALSAKLLLPNDRPVFFNPSRYFSTHSISLSLSSVWIISISRRGLTSPSTWMTSESSNARTTWKMPSTARTCDKKALPRPAPVDAP